MTIEDRTDDPALSVVDELIAVVPRLVERTRSQAEFARSVVGLLPCVGRLGGRRPEEPGPGVPEHERVDVLSVLSDDTGDDEPPIPAEAPGGPPTGAPPVPADAAAPDESQLPIQDYDSLAASQVVPRLATLSTDELESIRAYEAATRHRQTILNRVAQLLSS